MKKISSAPAARILGCSVAWIDKLAERDILPHDKVETGPGRFMRIFDRETVERVKEERETGKGHNGGSSEAA